MMNSLIAHWHLRFLPQSPSLLGTSSLSSSAQSEGDGRHRPPSAESSQPMDPFPWRQFAPERKGLGTDVLAHQQPTSCSRDLQLMSDWFLEEETGGTNHELLDR